MVWLLIKLLISLKVAFNQSYLASAGNIVNSEKFMGSGIKCDTYEPDSPKLVNSLFSLFTTALKSLCKTIPYYLLRVLLLSNHFLFV